MLQVVNSRSQSRFCHLHFGRWPRGMFVVDCYPKGARIYGQPGQFYSSISHTPVLRLLFDIACGACEVTVGLVSAPKFLSRRSSMITTLLCDQLSFNEMNARQVRTRPSFFHARHTRLYCPIAFINSPGRFTLSISYMRV